MIEHFMSHYRNRTAAVVFDLLMVPIAWMLAHWLRFNLGEIPQPNLSAGLAALPIVLAAQAALFWYFGLYRGVWRFASMPDMIRIGKAVLAGTLCAAAGIFLATRMADVPRSVFPLYSLLLVMLLGGARMLYRWHKDRKLYVHGGQRVLIVGAGRAGDNLVREMLRAPEHAYAPIGFVDDDRNKLGREIQGVRVVGTTSAIPELVVDLDVEIILIALPSASTAQMRDIVDICESTGLPFQTLPKMDDLVSGRAFLKELREVSIEDLLGREPVSLDWQAITAGLAGRRVLVSGGGGSIGSELCRQIAGLNPSELIVLDQSEYNLYEIDLELRKAFPALRLHTCLEDVTDAVAVERVMSQLRPEVVFHAAAYKHVPMLESQVRQAVNNNVLGTWTMAQAADRHGCGVFVLISTDKAVNPANTMGASKRAAEILCQNLDPKSATRFITVRFGNVLGSAGSVVPLFRRQIQAGGPLTVTHPKINRYFMTIPEACQLIMQAGAMGLGGEIFVLDMGEPVSITYLAEQMIRLSGKRVGEDIAIEFTGLRPGEKLYEELFHESENLASTGHEKILLARHRAVDWAVLDKAVAALREACDAYDETRLKGLVKQLVPEWQNSAEKTADNVIPLPGSKLHN